MMRSKILSVLISDRLFIFFYLLFLLLITVNFSYEIGCIFQPSSGLTNNYGRLTALFILVFVVLWIIAGNKEFKPIISRIGLSGKSKNNHVIYGIVIGLIFAIITLLIRGRSIKINISNFIYFIDNDPIFLITTMFIAPFIEEIVYRGLLITRLQSIFKRNNISNLIILISSAFLFAWIHSDPYHRLIGGFGFGAIYIWKKDLSFTIITHMATNIFIIFLT